MRPVKTLLAAALATAAATAGGATAIAALLAAPAPARTLATTPTIKLMKTSKGKILATKGGYVLYMFTHDTKNHNSCIKIKGCPKQWPALTTSGKPNTGPGVKRSLLGTIKLPSGKHQVTYAGHALYKYEFGIKGSISYVGVYAFQGYWYALNASGKPVK